jgi:hypothetical protein
VKNTWTFVCFKFKFSSIFIVTSTEFILYLFLNGISCPVYCSLIFASYMKGC